MAMGSTGTVNVTPEMIRSALSAINQYETTVKSLYSKLDSRVGTVDAYGLLSEHSNEYTYFRTDHKGLSSFLMKILLSLPMQMMRVPECRR